MLEVHATLETSIDLESTDLLSVDIKIEDDYKLPMVLRKGFWNFVETDGIIPIPPKNGFSLIPSKKIKFFECNGNIYKRVLGDCIQLVSRNGDVKNMSLQNILMLNPDFPKEENLEILVHRKQTYTYTLLEYAQLETHAFNGAWKHFTKQIDSKLDIAKKHLFDDFSDK